MQRKELKFIHITKCAGTTIEDLAIKHDIQWGRFHENEYGFWHNLPNHNLIEKYDWFMVVRNPYDRILSEYYCPYGGVGSLVHESADEMNKFLINHILNRHFRLGLMPDGHYIEQYRYYVQFKIHPKTRIHVLKFENLTTEFNSLMRTYKLNNKIKFLEKPTTSNKQRYTKADFSTELIDLINNVYAKDFAYFKYLKL